MRLFNKIKYFIFISVFLLSSMAYASAYVSLYPGNAELKLAGNESQFEDYFNIIDDPMFSASDANEIKKYIKEIDTSGDVTEGRVVYGVGDKEVYFSTDVRNGEKAMDASILFGSNCYSKIWLDGLEFVPTDINNMLGVLYLIDVGTYTILVSPSDGDAFYDYYARYEIEIVGYTDIDNYDDQDYKIENYYNNETNEYVYEYGRNEIFRSNIPMGIFTTSTVSIEAIDGTIFVFKNGESMPFNRYGDNKGVYNEVGHYVVEANMIGKNSALKVLAFCFDIIDGMYYTNEDYMMIPSGMRVLQYRVNNRIASPSYINNKIIALKEDGEYDVIIGMNDSVDSIEQMFIKDSNKKLLEFSKDISSGRVKNNIKIKQLKPSVNTHIYYYGSEIYRTSTLDRNGSYYIEASDGAGNRESYYLRIYGMQQYAKYLFLLLGFIVFVAVHKVVSD